MGAAEQKNVSQEVMNIIQFRYAYLEEFKTLFENLILYFHNNDIETPLFVQADSNYLGHIKVAELQKMYNQNKYHQDMKKFVDTFKKATNGGLTKFFYSNQLGTKPCLVTAKLF